MYCLGRLISITIVYSLLVAIIQRLYTLVNRLCISKLLQKSKSSDPATRSIKKTNPLESFDFKATEPVKYRPFMTKRHVTMGMFARGASNFSFPDAELSQRHFKIF